jgi:hypothetical protein
MLELVTDVSRYQRKLRPALMKQGGVSAVLIKATGGMSKDIRFDQHYADCQEDEMPTAAYHWVDPIYSPQRQIDTYLQTIGNKDIFAHVIDIEQYWGAWDVWYSAIMKKIAWASVPVISPRKIALHAYRTLEYLCSKTDKPVVVYTSKNFVVSYAQDMAEWLHLFPLMVAHYVIYPSKEITVSWDEFTQKYLPDPNRIPLLPPGTSVDNLVGWQFTGDRICLPGMYSDDAGKKLSPADVSLFDKEWLEKAIGHQIPDLQFPTAENHKTYYKVSSWVTRGLRLRELPNDKANILAGLKAGEKLEYANETNNDWIKVAYKDITGWVHKAYIETV